MPPAMLARAVVLRRFGEDCKDVSTSGRRRARDRSLLPGGGSGAGLGSWRPLWRLHRQGRRGQRGGGEPRPGGGRQPRGRENSSNGRLAARGFLILLHGLVLGQPL